MKKIGLILILGIIAFAPLSAQDYEGAVTFQSNRICEEGNNLVVEIVMNIHSSAVTKCQSMRLTPELSDGTNSVVMPYVEIQGKRRGQLNDRWETLRSKKYTYPEPYTTLRVNEKRGDITDETIDYSVAVPREAWMDGARLVVHQEIIGCYNEFRLFTFAMSGNVIPQPQAVQTGYVPSFEVVVMEPAPEVKHRSRQGQAYLDFPEAAGHDGGSGGGIVQDRDGFVHGYASSERYHDHRQGQAFLDFPVNKTVIYPDFRRNPEELTRIDDILNEIRNNPGVQIHDLYIHGYASPEGSYSNNDRLARERSYALKNYIQSRYNLPSNMFRVNYTAEDWNGLRDLVTRGDMPCQNQVVGIIDGNPSPDARKAQLQRLGGGSVWRMMLAEMFPGLRRVEYQVNYIIKDFTVEEAVSIIKEKGKEELLGHREMYLGARSFGKGTPQYEEIMIDRVLSFFPDDPIALSNAAALLIVRGDTETALQHLLRAGDFPAALNNLGALYLKLGELDEAESLLRRAAAGGISQAQYNLEQVRLKREDNAKNKGIK